MSTDRSSKLGSSRAPTADDSSGSDRFRRIREFRERVRARPGGRLAWRIGVGVLGLLIVVGGIILLPLPGPGWLIIFAGLGIWATEFEWASRLLRFARAQVGRWTAWMVSLPRWQQLAVGAGLVVLVAACILGAWWLYLQL
jgi:uncharacterized protein (TIGR02611 family)